jgi:hypothetical protein
MEKATVISLLEKYWQAETTVAEEQALAAYFQGADVDPGLQAYSDLFSYFHEEGQVSAGPGFGNRILQRLGLPLDEKGAGEGAPAHEAPVVPVARGPFGLGVAAAAAAIVAIVVSLFLLRPTGQPTKLADTRATTSGSRTETHGGGTAAVADTYDDPQQALAAVRRALLVASRNLNQGRREITGAANKRP